MSENAVEFRMEPIQAPTLKSHIASQLRAALLRGDLKPGARIVESRLAKQIGVAQTTVREAIQELETQGLLVKYVNRETQVRKLSPLDLANLFRVRRELEGLAVELAHPNATPEALAPLYQKVDEMRRAARRKDISDFYRSDIEFHKQLWGLARNEFLERSLAPLLIGPIAFVLAGAPVPLLSNYVEVADDHAHILDVMREESSKEARSLMERKLGEWHDLQMGVFQPANRSAAPAG